MKSFLFRSGCWFTLALSFAACISRGDLNVNSTKKDKGDGGEESASSAGKTGGAGKGGNGNDENAGGSDSSSSSSSSSGSGGSGSTPEAGTAGSDSGSSGSSGASTGGTDPQGEAGTAGNGPITCAAQLVKPPRIASGGAHTCAISGTGLKCWGDNGSGQLGVGDIDPRSLPVAVTNLGGKVLGVAGGSEHACALLDSGKVQCWGANKEGQLGTGDHSASLEPIDVVGITDAVGISAGFTHTCALRAGGTVQCWGLNENGEIGKGDMTTDDVLQPHDVSSLKGVVQIASGNSHNCAVLADCSVKCWGSGAYGQLGNNGTGPAVVPTSVLEDTQPLTGAVGVGVGQDHACAILKSGGVKCWGANSFQQSGPTGAETLRQKTATAVPGLSNVTDVGGGRDFTCARRSNGSVRCWGSRAYGMLGDGMQDESIAATPVVVSNLTTAEEISPAPAWNKYGFTCALLTDLSVVCWGQGDYGQLGNGSGADQVTPLPVQNFP